MLTTNLAYSPDPVSVEANSINILTTSGDAPESPSLFTIEKANLI